jgi:acetyl esterase/lipase
MSSALSRNPNMSTSKPSGLPNPGFAGIDALVDRVLITTGSKECLRDSDVALAELLRKHHKDVQMVVEKDVIIMIIVVIGTTPSCLIWPFAVFQ